MEIWRGLHPTSVKVSRTWNRRFSSDELFNSGMRTGTTFDPNLANEAAASARVWVGLRAATSEGIALSSPINPNARTAAPCVMSSSFH